jgi:hypothetical protein
MLELASLVYVLGGGYYLVNKDFHGLYGHSNILAQMDQVSHSRPISIDTALYSMYLDRIYNMPADITVSLSCSLPLLDAVKTSTRVH